MNKDKHKSAATESTVIDFPDAETLQDQAAMWVSKLDGHAPSDETIARFKQWYKQSPEHRAVFDKHMALWNDMNVLTQIHPPVKPQPRVYSIRGAWQQGIAVAAMLVVVVGLLFSVQSPEHYVTGIGEQKTITLNDGTLVILNTNTQVRIDYSEARRKVILDQGEAHFDIAHNPNRPFEVYAGQGLVRALGTAFTVYLKSDNVEVVVTEGTVAILPNQLALLKPGDSNTGEHTFTASAVESTAGSTIDSRAGTVVTYDRHTAEHIIQTVLADQDKKLSWHKGMLVFRDEPLENVIAEVNRYTPIKIVIPSKKVRELKVGGFFKVADIDSVFEALKKGFDIHAEVISDDVVYLVYRDEQEN